MISKFTEVKNNVEVDDAMFELPRPREKRPTARVVPAQDPPSKGE